MVHGRSTGGTLAILALVLLPIAEVGCTGGRTLEALPDAGPSDTAQGGRASGASGGRAGASSPRGGAPSGDGGSITTSGRGGASGATTTGGRGGTSGATTTGGGGGSATGGADDGEAGFGGDPDPGTCGRTFRFRDGPYTIASQADADRLSGVSEFRGHLMLENADDFSPLRCLTRVSGELVIDVLTPEILGLENLTEVEGEVDIFGAVESLGGLRALRRVTGSLSVGPSPSLVDLRGLDSLAEVGHLSVGFCDNLQSLRGLDALTAVQGVVHITTNPLLAEVSLPSSLTDLHSLVITGNRSLESLGLSTIQWIRVSLDVSNNDALRDLRGLESLVEVGTLQVGPGVQSLAGLENLTIVHSTLWLRDADLQSLAGLDSLHTIGDGLWIGGTITDVSGMPALRSVGGTLKIASPVTTLQGFAHPIQGQSTVELVDTDLTTLDGIENLSFRGLVLFRNSNLVSVAALSNVTSLEHLSIEGNEALTNLEGFENVTVVQDALKIVPVCDLDSLQSRIVCWHNGLTSLRGLRGLTSIGGTLQIAENPALASCEAEWLREHVGISNIGSIDIRENTGNGTCP